MEKQRYLPHCYSGTGLKGTVVNLFNRWNYVHGPLITKLFRNSDRHKLNQMEKVWENVNSKLASDSKAEKLEIN